MGRVGGFIHHPPTGTQYLLSNWGGPGQGRRDRSGKFCVVYTTFRITSHIPTGFPAPFVGGRPSALEAPFPTGPGIRGLPWVFLWT